MNEHEAGVTCSDAQISSFPTVSDVLLVVEVADTSLSFDLRAKVPLYARCGIDLSAAVGQRIACAALPEVAIGVGELFPG